VCGVSDAESIGLALVKQSSLATEKYTKHGFANLEACVVVKNHPFELQVGFDESLKFKRKQGGMKELSFDDYKIDIVLCYDNATLKEVDFVEVSPLVHVESIDEESGTLNIEAKIKVCVNSFKFVFCFVLFLFLFRDSINALHVGQKMFPSFFGVQMQIFDCEL